MYHFRIKSDKKPNGVKVSAVQHVEYINREGTFAHDEHWKETNKFGDNFITTAQSQNALDGFYDLLYKTDDFGSIKNSQRGIEVTDNASLTTIAIALLLTDESMQHKPLIVNGSSAFRKSVLTAATQANLNLSFQDKLLQRAFEQKKAEQDISPELTQSVQLTTKKIFENVAEAQNQQVALSHVEYINREKAYEKRGGCIFQDHHLPKWAQDDPKRFFKAADRYEGVGNRRYVEIEFALPNELKKIEQYRQIIDPFIEKHLSNHYYAYAIHNKNEPRMLFSYTLRERKKTAPNRPLRKNGKEEHLKTVNGVIANTSAKCVKTSLKFKMKCWNKTVIPFAWIIVLYRHKRKKQNKMVILSLLGFLVVCQKNTLE